MDVLGWNKSKSALILPVASISKKETSNKSAKKPKHLYIVPGAPTLFYQQGNQNLCILSSFESAFRHMGDGYASGYIISRKKVYLGKFRIKVECASAVIFLWDITKEKGKKTQLLY